jgi:hypothetical protein
VQLVDRCDIIQKIINKYGYKRYLEIGVFRKKTFNKIAVDEKIGVDPRVKTNYTVDSDKFFREYKGPKFDIVFVDGCHNGDYAFRDAVNSLKICNGVIVMHDCKPHSEMTQMREGHPYRRPNMGTWHGSVWRSWLLLRAILKYEMYVVDTDNGVGIINKSYELNKSIEMSACIMEYVDFAKRQQELLNLISVNKFLEKVK